MIEQYHEKEKTCFIVYMSYDKKDVKIKKMLHHS